MRLWPIRRLTLLKRNLKLGDYTHYSADQKWKMASIASMTWLFDPTPGVNEALGLLYTGRPACSYLSSGRRVMVLPIQWSQPSRNSVYLVAKPVRWPLTSSRTSERKVMKSRGPG